MTRKLLILLKKFLFFFIVFVAIYFALSFTLSRITLNSKPGNPQEITIYIITNGVHTDIAVPAITEQKDWSEEIKYANTIAADSTYKYVAFGWGDKKFYLETPEFSDLKVSTALAAITGLGNTAMHTTYYKNMIEDKTCKKIKISKAQYAQLVEYISSSFKRDTAGHYINIKTNMNYDNTDAFYEAIGSYSLLKTCNTWANTALKISGQKSCLWTIFDTGIFMKY